MSARNRRYTDIAAESNRSLLDADGYSEIQFLSFYRPVYIEVHFCCQCPRVLEELANLC